MHEPTPSEGSTFDEAAPLYPLIMQEAIEELSPLLASAAGFLTHHLTPIMRGIEQQQDMSDAAAHYYERGVSLLYRLTGEQYCQHRLLQILSQLFKLWVLSYQWSKSCSLDAGILWQPSVVASYRQIRPMIEETRPQVAGRSALIATLTQKVWEQQQSEHPHDELKLAPVQRLVTDVVDYYLRTQLSQPSPCLQQRFMGGAHAAATSDSLLN